MHPYSNCQLIGKRMLSARTCKCMGWRSPRFLLYCWNSHALARVPQSRPRYPLVIWVGLGDHGINRCRMHKGIYFVELNRTRHLLYLLYRISDTDQKGIGEQSNRLITICPQQRRPRTHRLDMVFVALFLRWECCRTYSSVEIFVSVHFVPLTFALAAECSSKINLDKQSNFDGIALILPDLSFSQCSGIFLEHFTLA